MHKITSVAAFCLKQNQGLRSLEFLRGTFLGIRVHTFASESTKLEVRSSGLYSKPCCSLSVTLGKLCTLAVQKKPDLS